jgi:hypothetical protein
MGQFLLNGFAGTMTTCCEILTIKKGRRTAAFFVLHDIT